MYPAIVIIGTPVEKAYGHVTDRERIKYSIQELFIIFLIS